MICELLSEEFSSVSGFILCTPSWENSICLSASNANSLEVHNYRIEIAEAWGNFFDIGGHN